MNYFSLFGLDESFTLDITALEKAYFREQRNYHPDRMAGKSDKERQIAIQKSMDINQGYNTLKDPLKRAQHIASLHDIIVGTEKDTIKPTEEMLIEVMELREEPPAKESLDDLINLSMALIDQYFTAGNFPAMAQETLRLGYLLKIRKDTK